MAPKTAVVFHYYEADETYRDNLIYFLSTALDRFNDFYVVVSGECTLDLPEVANLTYIYTENKNYDYGGYVAFFKATDVTDYDRFVFVNSSVRGPFMLQVGERSWLSAFTGQLSGNTHLFGSSVNILRRTYTAVLYNDWQKREGPVTHVQTTAYALTREAVAMLRDTGFYECEEALSKRDIVMRYELDLSQRILREGWDIGCALPGMTPLINPGGDTPLARHLKVAADPLKVGGYFKRTPSPYELIFIKTARGLMTDVELCSHTLTGLMQVAPLDELKPLQSQLSDKMWNRLKERDV